MFFKKGSVQLNVHSYKWLIYVSDNDTNALPCKRQGPCFDPQGSVVFPSV